VRSKTLEKQNTQGTENKHKKYLEIQEKTYMKNT
jgi:hypothetical protein